jgi:hypothetical protein
MVVATVERKNQEKMRKAYSDRPLVASSREDREMDRRLGREHKAAFRHLIGESPVCRAGEHVTAGGFYQKVVDALEQGEWSPSEREQLRRMRDLWYARANGRDARFEVVGTRPGRLSAREQSIVDDWGRVVEATTGGRVCKAATINGLRS